ncbi:MAG: DUF456 family protein [Candidatus Krumholzibacteriia bacterium]
MVEFLAAAGNVLFLALGAAVLLLHWVGLPANWILLGLALVYALVTRLHPVGWWSLLAMAGLAAAAEALEFGVGLAYTARKGATRWGVGGAFAGGILGGVAAVSIVPPLGSLVGAFLGAFLGGVAFEYVAQRKMDALRSGRAAFFGKVLAAVVKTMCGFGIWGILAYRILMAGG